jgi:hypothetical protein
MAVNNSVTIGTTLGVVGTLTGTTINAATIGNASATHVGAGYYVSTAVYGVLGGATTANTATVTTLSANGNATVNGLNVNTSGVFNTTLQALAGMQLTPIGNVVGMASTGSFTTITANGNITASAMTVNNSVTIGTTLGVTGNLNVGNVITTGTLYGNAAAGATGTISNAVGYMGMPQNSQSTGYTLALIDQGKHIYLTANSNITIPANSSVSFPIGSAISVVNGPNVQSNVIITTDTLYLAANGATGTRSISTYGMFTLVKVTNTVWYINGSGIT